MFNNIINNWIGDLVNLKQQLAQHEELWVPSSPELGYQVTCLAFLTMRRLIKPAKAGG